MNATLIALLTPLIGFLVLMFSSAKIERKLAGRIASGTVLFSFLAFLSLVFNKTTGLFTYFTWFSVPGFEVSFSLKIDPLSLLMALIITGVGYLIHVFSVGYMDHDEEFPRYFALLNFFIFSMLTLVLAGNLVLLFVGWEGVGLASYLLIGFWYHRPAAAQAATKAFVVNRIGDLGLLLGIVLTFSLFGTSDIATLCEQAKTQVSVGAPMMTLLTLLYFIGAIGKSAQAPLHVWLPDAMEGPTPVSALIHAATMVTAGVYLIVRLSPLFQLAPATSYLIAIVGAVTALGAAFAGVGQTELKRVLAYSTISQLGLMFLACGVGSYFCAMFHLTTHAFVKALLFLSAGNVIHMMHGATRMEKMGGLKEKLPKTNLLFLLGVVALSGIPPFAAFFSKDLLLDQVAHAGFHKLYLTGLIVSFLTAFYLGRAYFLTFTGTSRLEEKILKGIKEAPHVMLAPLAFLAFFSVFAGFFGWIGGQQGLLQTFLGNTLSAEHLNFEWSSLTLRSIMIAFAGLGASWFIYKLKARSVDGLAILQKAFFIDTIYIFLLVRPLAFISRVIAFILEPLFFEGILRSLSNFIDATGSLLQRAQSGQVRSYAAWMAIGAVALFVFLIF
ncbi:MAG: NADH-quinone oxidoreductase subunit L [Chlamydiia bacterium]|nr:NADH-quinone oxidoreductase subunit L [Chlamydiia bacterium]